MSDAAVAARRPSWQPGGRRAGHRSASPDWALPALAAARRSSRSLTSPTTCAGKRRPIAGCSTCGRSTVLFTPTDKFATTQHYGHPEVDPATFKLKRLRAGRTGRKALSLDDLRSWARPISSPASNAQAATADRCRACAATAAGPACRLKIVLDAAGVKAGSARVRLLRRRPRRRGSRVAHAEVQDRRAVRPQPERARRRCRRIRSSPGRSTASRSRAIRVRRCASSCRAGTASRNVQVARRRSTCRRDAYARRSTRRAGTARSAAR